MQKGLPAGSVVLFVLVFTLLIRISCRSLNTSCCSSWALFFQLSFWVCSLRAKASTCSLPLIPAGLFFIMAMARATLAFMKNHSDGLIPKSRERIQRARFKEWSNNTFMTLNRHMCDCDCV